MLQCDIEQGPQTLAGMLPASAFFAINNRIYRKNYCKINGNYFALQYKNCCTAINRSKYKQNKNFSLYGNKCLQILMQIKFNDRMNYHTS